MSTQQFGRVPFLPQKILSKHKAYEATDNRFRAAARLRQALLREQRGWPIGHYLTAKRNPPQTRQLRRSRPRTGGELHHARNRPPSPPRSRISRRRRSHRRSKAVAESALVSSRSIQHPRSVEIGSASRYPGPAIPLSQPRSPRHRRPVRTFSRTTPSRIYARPDGIRRRF